MVRDCFIVTRQCGVIRPQTKNMNKRNSTAPKQVCSPRRVQTSSVRQSIASLASPTRAKQIKGINDFFINRCKFS